VSLITSGHFYLGESGHYYLALTPYNITVSIHDRNKNGHERANEKGEIPSIGIKTALSIEKFNVDVLGNRYPAPPEKRRDLA